MTNPSHQILIEPVKGWSVLKLKELWLYRELFFFLAWRDVKVRYKQTFFGVAWVILQPLCTMIIFSLFFGKLAGIPSDGVPYPLFVLTGLVPWLFFANGASNASQSIVGDSNLIKKIYFPRIIIPSASVTAAFFDFLLTFCLLLLTMPYFEIYPTWRFLWLPVLMLWGLINVLGISFWLSAVNVMFRDVRYIIPFLMQIWMYSSPVVYSSSLVPEKWKPFFGLNPMAGIIDGYRWVILGPSLETSLSPMLMSASLTLSLTIFMTGLFYFRKIETNFADVV